MPENIFSRIINRGREALSNASNNFANAGTRFFSNFGTGARFIKDNANLSDGLNNFTDNIAGQIGVTAASFIPIVKGSRAVVEIAKSKKTFGQLIKEGLAKKIVGGAFKTGTTALLSSSALGLARTLTEPSQISADGSVTDERGVVTRPDGSFFTPFSSSNGNVTDERGVVTRPDGSFFTPNPANPANPTPDVSSEMSFKEVSDKNVDDFIKGKTIDPNNSPEQFISTRNNNDLSTAQFFQESLANNQRLQNNQVQLAALTERINSVEAESTRRLREASLGGRITGNQAELVRQEVATEFGQQLKQLKEYRETIIQENEKIENTAYRIAGLLDTDIDNARQKIAADFSNRKSEYSIGLAQLDFTEKSLTTGASNYTLVQNGYQALLQRYPNLLQNFGQEEIIDRLFEEFPLIKSALEQSSRLSGYSPRYYANPANYTTDENNEITFKQNFDTPQGQVDVNITTDADGNFLRYTGLRTAEAAGGKFNIQKVNFVEIDKLLKKKNGEKTQTNYTDAELNKQLLEIIPKFE